MIDRSKIFLIVRGSHVYLSASAESAAEVYGRHFNALRGADGIDRIFFGTVGPFKVGTRVGGSIRGQKCAGLRQFVDSTGRTEGHYPLIPTEEGGAYLIGERVEDSAPVLPMVEADPRLAALDAAGLTTLDLLRPFIEAWTVCRYVITGKTEGAK